MTAAPDTRNRELAQIHIAVKELGLDDETYRTILFTVARVRSAKDLNFEGRKRVLEYLRSSGFKPRAGTRRNAEWGWIDTAPEDKRKMLRKIAAMLRAAGRGKNYADGMTARMFHVDKLEFCAPDQLHKLIAALNFDARRRADVE